MDEYRSLALAIITQAVEDYQELTKSGATEMLKENVKISRHEIIGFFRSQWGNFLLKSIGGHYKGDDIINMLHDLDKSPHYIAAFDKKGRLVKKFDSLKDCAELAIPENVSRCCKGRRKTAGGYVWKYI